MEGELDYNQILDMNEALEYICTSYLSVLKEANLSQLIVDGTLYVNDKYIEN